MVLLAAGAWVAALGLSAKAELEAAMPYASKIKSLVVTGDTEGAVAAVDDMAAHTEQARDDTNQVVWRIAEIVPFVGPSLVAVRESATIAADLVDQVARPLASVASTFDPASLQPVDGALNLAPLVEAQSEVSAASSAADSAVDRTQAIDKSFLIGPVAGALDQLTTLLKENAPVLRSASDMLGLVPDALGATEPREYVLMFQNNAESRALGGTALSFALLTMNNGRIQLGEALPAGGGNFIDYAESVLPIPDGADAVYPLGSYGTFIPNVTVRPSFVSAGGLTHEMWKRQFGTEVDGVISVDPVALSYILGATGPITLSTGDVVTGDNLVPLLLNEVYMRYWNEDRSREEPTDNELQDQVYAEVMAQTFARFSSGQFDIKRFFAALTRATEERRIMLWSTQDSEESVFASLNVDGALPESDKKTDRVGVYFQDNVGSKMNFYLQQSVTLEHGVCRADGHQSSRINIGLTNGLPLDAADSISPSILGAYKREKLEPGVQRMIVMVYAPPGSQITGATVDGAAVELEQLHDTNYPVAKFTVSIDPGATSAMTVDLVSGDTGEKALEAQVTPMVNPTTIAEAQLDCSTAAAS